MTPQRTLPLLLCACIFALFPACTQEITEEEFTTEFRVLEPLDEPGWIEIDKRFRFSADPSGADSVKLASADLTILSPSGADFAFLDRFEVFVVLDEERALIATSGDYQTSNSRLAFDIEFDGDLREFISDERVSLTFVAYPSRWYSEWPAEGFRIQAHVILELDIF